MQVLKFGGSSVANAENINKVVSIVQKASQKDKTIVVVSAFGGITDKLLSAAALAATGDELYSEQLTLMEKRHLTAVQELMPVAKQSSVLSSVKKQCNEIQDICNGIFLLKELSAATKDRVVAFGELISSQIISAKFNSDGVENQWIDSRQLIITDNNYGNAKVDFEQSNTRIKEYFEKSTKNVFILPGFIASGPSNGTTTLGRGGSDYTAAIIAAALDADVLEIWTDVSGIMTADPNQVSTAKIIAHISYQEAMELSHFGAKVIYPPTMQPVLKRKIPVKVKNTFAPSDEGTVIDSGAEQNGNIIRGIT
ncbi:MAG: aspartate kinase, partial [Flavitalea sp.]